MRQYPIGIQDFAKIINGNMVYVDKTDLVYQLASSEGVYFLSRPRRFGKSLLVSTLKYYFLGRKDLFKGLKMEELEKDWTEYPVFEIDFNGKDYTQEGALVRTLEGSVSSWERIYGKSPDFEELGDRFAYVLHQAHEKTGHRCVVLIDEYDKPMLDVMDTGLKTTEGGAEMTLEERNRNTLKAFYSTFKAADADLRFVFLTGVTKFAQVSVFSGFNNAQDISMVPDFDSLCGISQEELDTNFHDAIEALGKANGLSYEETAQLLKETYDGYHFSKAMTDIYNPFSLLNTFKRKDFSDYWFATGTPTYLLRLLAHNDEDLSQIVGREYT
ncbi:MAG: AAA family ATPase, partial [Prevotella sp.]|nr:AAA family ATPase [Prevotella sp.]